MDDTVTVGRLREILAGFEDATPVVVPHGMGYEEPKVSVRELRPVAVPHRYVSKSWSSLSAYKLDRPVVDAVVLVGWNN